MKIKNLLFLLLVFLIINTEKVFSQVEFTVNVFQGCYPLEVIFTNTSTGGTFFYWNFGDGQTAATENTTHTFLYSGTYNVDLKVYDAMGNYLGEYHKDIFVKGANRFVIHPNDTVCPNEVFNVGINNQYDSIRWNLGNAENFTYNWPSISFDSPGIYNITLYSYTECGYDSVTQQVVVSNSAIPNQPYFNPSGFQFCAGDAIPFTSNNFYHTYSWDFDDGYTSSEQNPVYSYSSLGFRNVTLTVMNICGISNSYSANIDIAQNVPANADFSIPEQVFCPNEPIRFSASGGTNFLWNFGDGNTASVMETKYLYGDTGTYTSTLIVSNGCGNSDTSQQTITIGYNPSDLPYAMAGFLNNNWDEDTMYICTGEEIAFQAYVNGQGSITTQWDFDDGFFSDEKNPVHTFLNNGVHEIKFIATNNCNGKDTVKKWVIANPNAYPVSNINAIPRLICPGENVYFFDDGNRMLESGYDYSIWFGDGDSLMHVSEYSDSLIEVVSHQYPEEGSYIFTFTVTNACGNVKTLTDTIVVENDPLNETFYYVDNSTTEGNDGNQDYSGCLGDAVTFRIVGGTSYVWHFGDGATSTENYTLHTYQDTGIFNAYVVATNACGRIDTVETTVTISSTNTPSPWFHVDTDEICAGEPILFKYSDQDLAANYFTYFWDFRDGTTANTMNVSHAFAQGGEYNVKLVVENGCGRDSSFRFIRVRNPVTNFMASQYVIPENTSVTFTNLTQNANSYLWNFGDGSTSTSANPSHLYTTVGIYPVSLTATNQFGCSSSFTDTIYVNDLFLSSVVNPNTCANTMDGYIDITATGGLPPYNYKWYYYGNLISNSQDIVFYNLGYSEGSYQVVVTDQNGISVTENFTIVNPAPLNISLTATDEVCGNDGTATANVTGGASPYTYLWANSATGNVVSNLASGFDTLFVTVTDNNGCVFSNLLTVNISPNNEIIQNINIGSIAPSCGNSDGRVWVSSINPPDVGQYSYIWNDQIHQQNDTAFNIPAGYYQVSVTNTNTGCSVNEFITISNPSNTYITSLIVYSPNCFGGNNGYATISAGSPDAPLSVAWSTNPIQTNYMAQNLSAGMYSVTITDQLNCFVVDSFQVFEPAQLQINMTHSDPLCFGSYNGNAITNVSGGTQPYTYHWNNGSPYASLLNRNANTYSVTVSDANMCTETASVTLQNPPQITATSSIQDVTFYGLSNGTIDLTPTGGTPPYTYTWSNGAQIQDIEQLAAGTYSVTIQDANNCTANASFVVGQPTPLNVTISSTGSTVFCYGESVQLDAGNGYLQYQWSNGVTTQTTTAAESGYYSVSCTGSNSYGVDSIYVNVAHPYSQQDLCLVTVDSLNFNKIIWEKPESESGIVMYKLYKETTASNVYELLATIPYSAMTMYIDTESNPAQQSDRYKISLIDTCGNESDLSEAHKTMHLTVNTGVGVYNLIWENYEGFTFPSYTIYRGTSPDFMLPIGAIQSNLTTFTDYQPVGAFYYRIAVMKSDSCWASGNAKDMAGPFSQSLSNIEDNGIIDVVNANETNHSGISIWPNPFNEKTSVYFTNTENKPYCLFVTDITGKVVYEKENITGNYFVLNKGNLLPGFYTIELKGEKSFRGKIIIE